MAESGAEQSETIVFLHGFPEYWACWQPQLTFFTQAGMRVLAPDQRGYNLSDKPRPSSAYRLDVLADDIVGLLDAFGIERVTLVGHDWGGMVAWWTANNHPERIRRLVILNAPHPVVMRRFLRGDSKQRRRSWYIFFFQLPWLPERWYRRRDFEIGLRSVVGTARPGTFSDEQIEGYREAWARPGALRAMIQWYRAALRHRARGPNRPIGPPTLVLWGERDPFLDRRMIEPSLELCDNARLQTFPEATHWLQHEEPSAVNEAILGFARTPENETSPP